MIAALLAKIGIGFASRWTSAFTIALMLACAALSFWRGMATIDSMLDDSRQAAIAMRDAHWRAEIAESNLVVERERAAAAQAAAETEARATNTITGLQKALADLETSNANLPNGDRCGLDAGRVRLLNR
jgi:hypothetical protein